MDGIRFGAKVGFCCGFGPNLWMGGGTHFQRVGKVFGFFELKPFCFRLSVGIK